MGIKKNAAYKSLIDLSQSLSRVRTMLKIVFVAYTLDLPWRLYLVCVGEMSSHSR